MTNEEIEDETTCKRCNKTYSLREGCEPTKYCDICAHAALEEAEKQIASLIARLAEAEKDKKRLDWLQRAVFSGGYTFGHFPNFDPSAPYRIYHKGELVAGKMSMDEAIDAAMEGGK